MENKLRKKSLLNVLCLYFLIFAFLIGCNDSDGDDSGGSNTTTGSVSGVISDSTRVPVSEAIVSVLGRITTTNTNGAYSIGGFQPEAIA